MRFEAQGSGGGRGPLPDIDQEVRVTFLAVYGPRATHPDADLVLEVVPHPRVFEWNVMHHRVLENSCVDIDGTLCHDPTSEENDDGERYDAFLAPARPSSSRPSASTRW